MKSLRPHRPVALTTLAGACAFAGLVIAPPAQAAAGLSGTVTAVGGAPVSGAEVEACQWDAEAEECADSATTTTLADGTYSFASLEDGDYRIGFFADGFVEQWYDAAEDVESADTIVIEDEAFGGIDAELVAEAVATGSLAGTVTGTSGPLAEVEVEACQWEAGEEDCLDYFTATTGADGTYLIEDLPAGPYKIGFLPSDGHVEEYYANKPDLDSADQVAVADGPVTGIDAQLAAGGSIAGAVTGPGGPLVGVEVEVCRWDAVEDWCADSDYVETGAGGAYTATGLAPGTYKVGFVAEGLVPEWYDDQPSVEEADEITVAAAPVTGIDAALVSGGSLAGTVTGASGPLADIEVEVCRWEGVGDDADCTDDYFTTTTAANGRYLIEGLPLGDYKVGFLPENTYVAEYYDDQPDVYAADEVAVTLTPVTGIDAVLASGSSLSGTVTGVSGQPLADLVVEVCRWNAADEWCDDYYEATTDAAGAYRATGLPPGPYKVHFIPEDGEHTGEWFDDEADEMTATEVPVAAGAAVTGIDAQLADDASIAGRVTGAEGQALGGVEVTACVWDPSWDDCGEAIYSDTTDNSGAYAVTGLGAGDYRIVFRPAASDTVHAPQWYDDAPFGTVADEVEVAPGADLTGIDAQLHRAGAIAGTISLTGAGDRAGASVEACLWSTRDAACMDYFSGVTAADGTYRVGGLTPGDYKVYFYGTELGGGYKDEYYDDRPASDEAGAKLVIVGGGTTVDGIDAILGTTRAPNDPDGLPDVVNTVAPTVTGEARVGETLVAAPGSWKPTPTSFTYTWLADGVPVAGATGASLVITEALVGKTLRVLVTAVLAGHESGEAPSAPTIPVVPEDAAPVENTSAPVVTVAKPAKSGAPTFKSQLTVSDGTWSPEPDLLAYQWLADGKPIAGATKRKLTIGAAQVGTVITATVTATAAGFADGSATSAATGEVEPKKLIIKKKPKVKGTVKGKALVGRTLSVTKAKTSPKTKKVTYRWLANGKAIKKANKPKLKLTAALAGKKISVVLTYTAPGYLGTVTVKAGKVVKAPRR